MRHGQTRMILNVAALLLFLVNALVHVGQFTAEYRDDVGGFILALLGVGCTVAVGYFGGR
jgi:hypothetical protein